MEKIWYLYVSGQQLGPMSLEEVQQKIASGQAKQNDFAFRQGMENWQTISSIGELQIASAPNPPPQAPVMPAQGTAAVMANESSVPDASAMTSAAQPIGVEVKSKEPSHSDSGARKTLRTEDDLSVLMEMRKEDFTEKTERIDIETIRQAQKEAKAAEKSAEKDEGRTGLRMLKFLFLIILAASILAYVASQTGWLEGEANRNDLMEEVSEAQESGQ